MTANELKNFLKTVYEKQSVRFDCNGYAVFYNRAENVFRYVAYVEDPTGSTVKNGVNYREEHLPFATAYKSPVSGNLTIVFLEGYKTVLNGNKKRGK